jgi:hypothetical protein
MLPTTDADRGQHSKTVMTAPVITPPMSNGVACGFMIIGEVHVLFADDRSAAEPVTRAWP